ncbi:hypothetical protein KKF63_03785, partial [bacterium]|nr:hypothetical protein [bacterium]
MKNIKDLSPKQINQHVKIGTKLPLATSLHYPSRGQTAIQELYLTKIGKLFLKKTSKRNHQDCQVNEKNGSLAEREYWCFCLARYIGLNTPPLWLIDKNTTIQIWFNIPDAHIYTSSHGKMFFLAENIYNCALFDWLTGQIDRHNANYLYDYINKKIILIDSAHSLLKHTGSLPDYLEKFELINDSDFSKKQQTIVSKKLLSLSKNKLEQLIPLKDLSEKKALLWRHNQIKQINTIKDI